MKLNYAYSGQSREFGIYQIHNTHTDRFYVGQTSRCFNKRWAEHSKALLDISAKSRGASSKFLKNDFLKCLKLLGHDGFLVFSVVEIVSDKANLNGREIFHIDAHRKRHGKSRVYNILNGGQGSIERGHNISVALKGRHLSPKTEFKQGQTFEERFGDCSMAIKQKISEIHKGKPLSEKHKQAISIAHMQGKHYLRGKTFEEVFGDKKAEKLKKRLRVTTASRPSNRLGKKHSIDSLAKMKQSAQARIQYGLKNPTAKIYKEIILVSPTGDIITQIECLSAFCRDNNLIKSAMCRLLQGKAKSHKGWFLNSDTYKQASLRQD